ncbi:MAG: NAD-dependent deacylase, partial [Chromatiales bacterium]|nr:NAD-dependent deacylase [Chromatiales bacterium]
MDDRLIQTLRESASTVFLTGAGVSAESGIPTFRDAMTGLWSRYRPEELATPDGFERDPELVWRW